MPRPKHGAKHLYRSLFMGGLVIVGGLLAGVAIAIAVAGSDHPSLEVFSKQERKSITADALLSKPLEVLELKTVQDAVNRQAVCNDGSPAKYYYRPGTEANKDKWIIFFKGGGGCSSDDSCLERAKEDGSLISSKGYAATIREGGIFSTDTKQNSDFSGWNHVKIMYCSSDNFIGDQERQIGGKTWYFNGQAITQAVLEDLQNLEVTNAASLAQASDIIVAGSSAGGSGAIHHLDEIATMFPTATVKGFIDSSWGLGLDPYAGEVQGVEEDRYELSVFANKQFDSSCVATNQDNPDACTTVANVYPYIDNPAFIFINQLDQKKLSGLGIRPPLDEGEREWLDDVFLPALFTSFKQVDKGLFSAKESFHTVLTSSEFFNTRIDGISVQEAFTNWYFDRPGAKLLIEK